ncbi:MAG: UbiA family prenyltransferase [Draconibacterium sp.]|nr:UbiA family prenyltransferase [Draconibacterium sp.]
MAGKRNRCKNATHKNRPIPSGKISRNGAFAVAVGFAAIGSAILIFTNPIIALILSWVTLFFYNIVYTPLKKVSAFAVIPGSMVGALPPMIGWAGAGGSLTSEIILLVATFFFIGQIPHFWLLLMMFGDQYKLAGMPSLNQIFNENQLKRITYTWVLVALLKSLPELSNQHEHNPYLSLSFFLHGWIESVFHKSCGNQQAVFPVFFVVFRRD